MDAVIRVSPSSFRHQRLGVDYVMPYATDASGDRRLSTQTDPCLPDEYEAGAAETFVYGAPQTLADTLALSDRVWHVFYDGLTRKILTAVQDPPPIVVPCGTPLDEILARLPGTAPIRFTATGIEGEQTGAAAVQWAWENGIARGMSETEFCPHTACTRAQVVTFLWRLDGAEPQTGDCPFTDVPRAYYYRNAVVWAYARRITNGTSETTFSPNASCTRGQIVTFLYNRSEG